MLILTQEKKSKLYLSNYISNVEPLAEETTVYTARFKEVDRSIVFAFLMDNIKGLYILDDGVFATGAEDVWIDFVVVKKAARAVFSYHRWTKEQDLLLSNCIRSCGSLRELHDKFNSLAGLHLTCNAIQQRLKVLKVKIGKL